MSPTFDLSIIERNNELDGNPDQLDRMVNVLRTNAEAISNANASLRKLTVSGNEMESKAFGALAEKALEVGGSMQKAALRYRLMSTAIQEFSQVLRDEQSKVPGHLESLRQARQSHARALADHETAKGLAKSVDDGVRKQALDLNASAVSRSHSASQTFESHRTALSNSINVVRSANSRSATKVQSAIDVSDLDDSLLDKVAYHVKKFAKDVSDFVKGVWDNLEIIVVALACVAILVTAIFVPVGLPFVIKMSVKAVVSVTDFKAKVNKVIETGKSVWTDLSAGNLKGAAKTLLKAGVDYAVGKVIKAASKDVAKFASSEVSKRLYSLQPDGTLHSTATGRVVNDLVTRFGPVMFPGGGPLPPDFASQHIHRTTKVIGAGAEYLIKESTKAGLKNYYNTHRKPIVDGVIDSVAAGLAPSAPRCYVFVEGPDGVPITRRAGGGGGGGGW